jgi:excisionase family DNA binding protein
MEPRDPHADLPDGTVAENADRPGHDGSPTQHDALLTPGEVAQLFGVDPKTVTRWATAGKLTALRTLGGHRRYRASEVRGLLGDDHTARHERR